MSNRPEAGERSGLVEGENEARQRSAVSNRAVTLGDAVSSIETSNCQIPVGKQDPRESESRPHSIGRITTAFVATALVVMGTLVVTGALLVIAALIPLGIDAARSVYVRVLTRQITGDAGTTIGTWWLCMIRIAPRRIRRLEAARCCRMSAHGMRWCMEAPGSRNG